MKATEGECTFERARYYWNTLMARVAEALVSGGYTSVDFGYWRFELAVAGSVPTANSPLTAANYVYIAVYPSAELQQVAASIETAPNTAAQAFEILEVYGHDHVRGVFTANTTVLITGKRLTMGGTGEKVELIIGNAVYACTNMTGENDLNTRIRVKVPYVTAGSKKATLRITAFGKGRTVLSTIEKDNIEVVYVAPATPHTLTKVSQEANPDNQIQFDTTMEVDVLGTNLSGFNASRGDTVKWELVENGVVTDTSDNTQDIASTTATQIHFEGVGEEDPALPFRGSLESAEEWYGKHGRVKVTINGVTKTVENIFFTNT